MIYEMIREIFNRCSGNQMRDVFVQTVETDDPEQYMEQMLSGKDVKIEKSVFADGSIQFDVETAGLKQRFSFTED